MLKKNVYLFFPPGYAGNFLNWSINKADKDTGPKTVDNPINTTDSIQLGGAGTSHLHTRIPTHQGVHMHLAWVLLHKPINPMVYCISTSTTFFIETAVAHFAQFDKDGIFVNIHHDNNENIDMFGVINIITKWPTYLDFIKTSQIDHFGKKIDVSALADPYNCGDSREFRNWMVKHYNNVLPHAEPFNRNAINGYLDNYLRWYTCRNRAQPHEVNEQQYITPNVNLKNRIVELSLLDICSENYIPWLEQFMKDTQCSDEYDLDHVRKIHLEYLAAQKNLQWFTAIDKWTRTGEIDPFFISHAGIEAMVIVKMEKRIGSLDIDWETMDLYSINEYYQHKIKFSRLSLVNVPY